MKHVFVVLTIFFGHFTTAPCLESLSSWNALFRSSVRRHISTDLVLQHRQAQFSTTMTQKTNYPFVFKMRNGCGQQCHDQLAAVVSLYHQSECLIINSDHALVYTDIETAENLHQDQLGEVEEFVPFLPELKIDADLDISQICLLSSHVSFNVIFFKMSSEEVQFLKLSLSESVKRGSYSIRSGDIDAVAAAAEENIVSITTDCSIAQDVIDEFSLRPYVQWIERSYEHVFFARYANGVVQSGDPDELPLYAANLTGEGEVIGIADTGLDPMSCFFFDDGVDTPYNIVNESNRKVIYYKTQGDDQDLTGHGTLVSALAAGRCSNEKSSNYRYNGAAYDAKIAFIDLSNGELSSSGQEFINAGSNHYSGIYQVLYDVGSRVMTMSWGSQSNAYTSQARYVDSFMWDYPESIILFAAGNSGESGLNSVGSPATNKNGIAVGASLNDKKFFDSIGVGSKRKDFTDKGSVAYFSSRGPTQDGRLKPDICSVGMTITGAESQYPPMSVEHCSIRADQGTSFSAPLLAGYAAIIRQYFRDGYYKLGYASRSDGFTPSGALIKAIIIHSGQPLTDITDLKDTWDTAWGDNNQGYGRAEIDTILSFTKSTLNGLTLFVMGAADPTHENYAEMSSSSGPHQYNFTTQDIDGLSAVRVTLVYTDFPGVIGSNNVLINDLDVMLSNDTHVFHPMVTTDSARKYDRKNTIEFIILKHPRRNSNYTVTVTGYSISHTQPYALVISGEVAKFDYLPRALRASAAGLSETARITIFTMLCLSCCLTACVIWIGFANPDRRSTINHAKDFR